MTHQFATVLPFPAPGAREVGGPAAPLGLPLARPVGGRATCGCGHSVVAHEHPRLGTDCGFCGARHCPSFRPAPRAAAGA